MNLFWTGGWDSTFRLLQLLVDEKRSVQAIYIMRSEQCSGIEIDIMANIRRFLHRNHPENRTLLKPMVIEDVYSIKSNQKINATYEKVSKEKKVNKQYEILARYCEQKNISAISCWEPLKRAE